MGQGELVEAGFADAFPVMKLLQVSQLRYGMKILN
jgi:hypothetical protein